MSKPERTFSTFYSQRILIVFIVFLIFDFLQHVPVSPSHLALIPIFLYVKMAAVFHASHFTAEFIPKGKDIKPVK